MTFKNLNLVPSTSQAYVAPQAEDSVFENRGLVKTFQNQTIVGASMVEKRPTCVRVLWGQPTSAYKRYPEILSRVTIFRNAKWGIRKRWVILIGIVSIHRQLLRARLWFFSEKRYCATYSVHHLTKNRNWSLEWNLFEDDHESSFKLVGFPMKWMLMYKCYCLLDYPPSLCGWQLKGLHFK